MIVRTIELLANRKREAFSNAEIGRVVVTVNDLQVHDKSQQLGLFVFDPFIDFVPRSITIQITDLRKFEE